MSGVEKFLFLGAVTLAALVVSQAPEGMDAPVDMLQASPPDGDAGSAILPAPPEETPPPPPVILTLSPEPASYLTALSACPGLSTSHGANVDAELHVTNFSPQVVVSGKVRLAAAPVGGGCYSSGFGMRNGKLHKGVDYYSADAVPVFAAAGGKVRSRAWRNDYGNMLVIDHGDGVYTRYAHLESFADIRLGDRVSSGQQIGIMGNTAGYTIPRHLHYEVLTGTWQPLAGSFALTPVDVLSLPAAE